MCFPPYFSLQFPPPLGQICYSPSFSVFTHGDYDSLMPLYYGEVRVDHRCCDCLTRAVTVVSCDVAMLKNRTQGHNKVVKRSTGAKRQTDQRPERRAKVGEVRGKERGCRIRRTCVFVGCSESLPLEREAKVTWISIVLEFYTRDLPTRDKHLFHVRLISRVKRTFDAIRAAFHGRTISQLARSFTSAQRA